MSDGARTLFIADFNDTSVAHEAYGALKSLEDGRHFAIDGVIVVNRDADGNTNGRSHCRRPRPRGG